MTILHVAFRLSLTIALLLAGAACRTSKSVATVKDDMSAQLDCSGASDAVGDPVDWLKAQDQETLERIFLCAPSTTATPIGLGLGRGSLYQDWPLWNELQSAIGTYIWGGKRLYLQADGKATCLLNQMEDSQTERYLAHVYVQKSNHDKKNVVVLDYRIDNTKGIGSTPAEVIVDQIVRGIRDEIREITQNGVGTKVFIGRANVKTSAFFGGDLSDISDADFRDPNLYTFGANFFLDFRPNTVKAFGNTVPACVGARDSTNKSVTPGAGTNN